jgi:hypothetical protein
MRESVRTILLPEPWKWEPFWNNSYALCDSTEHKPYAYVIWRLNGGFNVNIKAPSGIPHASNLPLNEAFRLAEMLVITGAV